MYHALLHVVVQAHKEGVITPIAVHCTALPACHPLGNIAHPREKLDEMGTWKCSSGESLDEATDAFDGRILRRHDGGMIIYEGHDRASSGPMRAWINILCMRIVGEKRTF